MVKWLGKLMMMAGFFLLLYHNITPHHHEVENVHGLGRMHHTEGPLERVNIDHHFYHHHDLVYEFTAWIATPLFNFKYLFLRPATVPLKVYTVRRSGPFPPDPFLTIPDHRGPPHC